MEFDPKGVAYIPTTGVRRVHETPLIAADDESLKGYGCLVVMPTTFPIEIVRWLAQGWQPVDHIRFSFFQDGKRRAYRSRRGPSYRCMRRTRFNRPHEIRAHP